MEKKSEKILVCSLTALNLQREMFSVPWKKKSGKILLSSLTTLNFQ